MARNLNAVPVMTCQCRAALPVISMCHRHRAMKCGLRLEVRGVRLGLGRPARPAAVTGSAGVLVTPSRTLCQVQSPPPAAAARLLPGPTTQIPLSLSLFLWIEVNAKFGHWAERRRLRRMTCHDSESSGPGAQASLAGVDSATVATGPGLQVAGSTLRLGWSQISPK
jgi:hypothetical protein